MSELNPLSGETLDLTKENIEKLKELFPEVLTENQIDFEKLRLILGDEINDKPEKYSFTWNGKNNAIKLAQHPSTGTLRPNKDKSKNWDTTENLYIEGDNLEVLKLLQKSYARKVKVIYIDPPYNTGNDFVYKDDYKDNIQNYFEQTGQIDGEGNKLSTNTDYSGRFHTDWLNMMYPRLYLAKNLLRDDGVIFISIDDNEQSRMKAVCDEIFSERNFVGQFTWIRKKKGSFLNKRIRNISEYVLMYQKKNHNTQYFGEKAYSDKKQPIVKRTNAIKNLIFPSGTVYTTLGDGDYKSFQVEETTKVSFNKDFKVKDGVVTTELDTTARYVWTQDFLNGELVKGTEVHLSSQFGFNVLRNDQKEKVKASSSLIDSKVDVGTNEDATEELAKLFNTEIGQIFNYAKPISLIKYLVNMITYNDKDAMILDFFAGTSTTAAAVMELNIEDSGDRKFMMIQLPEVIEESNNSSGYTNISDISQERIRKSGNNLIKESKLLEYDLDIGFKVFELDNSNIQRWNVDSKNIEESLFSMENNFIEGRSQADIVFEVLLKMGLDLNTPFEENTVDGSTIYDVAHGNIYVVLGENITQEVANYIVDKQKDYENENPSVVFNDNGFVNDNEKLNTIETLKNNGFNQEQLMSI